MASAIMASAIMASTVVDDDQALVQKLLELPFSSLETFVSESDDDLDEELGYNVGGVWKNDDEGFNPVPFDSDLDDDWSKKSYEIPEDSSVSSTGVDDDQALVQELLELPFSSLETFLSESDDDLDEVLAYNVGGEWKNDDEGFNPVPFDSDLDDDWSKKSYEKSEESFYSSNPDRQSIADSLEYIEEPYRETAREYCKRIVESNGYDLDKHYGWPGRIGGFMPVDLSDTSSLAFTMLSRSVDIAIRKENKKKDDPDDRLELIRLLRATTKSCYSTYFATFGAKSKREGNKIYQCKVWYNCHNENKSHVLGFRVKPDKLMSYVNDWLENHVDKPNKSLVEEEEKEEEEEARMESDGIQEDVALKEMTVPTAREAQERIREGAPGKQEQLCELSRALAIWSAASSVSGEREEFLRLVNREIEIYNGMVEKEGTDGELGAVKAYRAAREESDPDSDAGDEISSALIDRVDAMLQNLEKEIDDVHAKIGDRWQLLDRDHDGKVTPEELASAAMYVKNTLGKEGVQELISSLSKDKDGNGLYSSYGHSFLLILSYTFSSK